RKIKPFDWQRQRKRSRSWKRNKRIHRDEETLKMADNIHEEHLDDPANTRPEDPAVEIIPAKHIDPVNPKQQTENMEVHKHPHHVTHKKKWGEYLLEFLMLFLAVTMGFFAEQ